MRFARPLPWLALVVLLFCSTAQALHAQQGQAGPIAPELSLPQTPLPAATGETAKAKPKQGFWYKLCDEQPESKRQICFTFHEQVSVSTGRLYISAALRKVADADTEHLLIVVPPGVAVRPGLQVTIDDQEPIILNYIICQPKGCTAEGEATEELVEQLKSGKNMVVAVIDVTGKLNRLRVPLDGFTIAHRGPAVDKEQYFKAWQSQLQRLRRAGPQEKQ